MQCNTKSNHIDWYARFLNNVPVNWTYTNSVLSHQYFNAHEHLECADKSNVEQFAVAFDERVSAIIRLREAMNLQTPSFSMVYEYFITTRPVSLQNDSVAAYQSNTARIVQQIQAVTEREHLIAEDFLVVTGVPEIFLKITDVFDRSILDMNHNLAAAGHQVLRSYYIEQLILKMTIAQPEEVSGENSNKGQEGVYPSIIDGSQQFSWHSKNKFTYVALKLMVSGWVHYRLDYWKNVIDEQTFDREKAQSDLHDSLLSRIMAVNNLRGKAGLWLYDSESIGQYLRNNCPEFIFLRQAFDFRNYNEQTAIIQKVCDSLSERSIPEVEVYITCIGLQAITEQQKQVLRSKIAQYRQAVEVSGSVLISMNIENKIREFLLIKPLY